MSKKGDKLDKTEAELMRILNNHEGLTNRIAAMELADLIGKTDRRLRGIVSHLIFEHKIPIISSMRRKESGYFLSASHKEAKEFWRVFRRRALTSLAKAAKIMKISNLEASVQLVIDSIMEGEKIPGVGKVVSHMITLFKKYPGMYEKEIEALQEEAAPLLIPRERFEEIDTAINRVKELTRPYLQPPPAPPSQGGE